MENGQWLLLPVRKVKDGLSRIHEDDYKISIEKRKVCEDLYLAAQRDQPALLARIQQCEADYRNAEATGSTT